MRAAPLLAAAVLALGATVTAVDACPSVDPERTFVLEAGMSSDAVTKGRGPFEGRTVSLAVRGANRFFAYALAENDSRFGANDSSYEAGAGAALSPHVNVSVAGSLSPTHNFLAASSESAGVDVRGGDGYGLQAAVTQRNYPLQTAAIVSLGGDRYAGVNRFAFGVTLARLTSVPGTALTTKASFQRYLPCDQESFSVSAGRDVESTGVGAGVAVFQSVTYDVNDVHWFTRRFGVNVGAGWYLLTGAYNRLQLRLALRDRF